MAKIITADLRSIGRLYNGFRKVVDRSQYKMVHPALKYKTMEVLPNTVITITDMKNTMAMQHFFALAR